MNEASPTTNVANQGADLDAVFRRRLDQVAGETEAVLERLLAPAVVAGERQRAPRLLEAMRYASLGGGKRLRPFLVVERAAWVKVACEQALMAGPRLDCVHCGAL